MVVDRCGDLPRIDSDEYGRLRVDVDEYSEDFSRNFRPSFRDKTVDDEPFITDHLTNVVSQKLVTSDGKLVGLPPFEPVVETFLSNFRTTMSLKRSGIL